jgi:photosystem II stability/assembly factor-like uncharacterized protein
VCFSGGDGALVKTTNGGRSWKAQKIPMNAFDRHAGVDGWEINQVVCASTSVCEVVGNDLLLRTVNGGATWTTQRLPVSAKTLFWGASCPTESTCVAVGTGGTSATATGVVLRTVDGGRVWVNQHWNARLEGAAFGYPTIVSCSSTSRCEVGGFSNRDVWGAFETLNGGASWTLDQIPTDVDANIYVNDLSSIQCFPSGACEMAGQLADFSKGTEAAMFGTEHGVDWTSQSVPYPGV